MRVKSNNASVLVLIGILVLVQFMVFGLLPRIRVQASGEASQSRTVLTEQISPPAVPNRVHLSEAYGHIPMSFVANQGQSDSSVEFFTRGRGFGLFLTRT